MGVGRFAAGGAADQVAVADWILEFVLEINGR
jgi:hypothetical protein